MYQGKFSKKNSGAPAGEHQAPARQPSVMLSNEEDWLKALETEIPSEEPQQMPEQTAQNMQETMAQGRPVHPYPQGAPRQPQRPQPGMPRDPRQAAMPPRQAPRPRQIPAGQRPPVRDPRQMPGDPRQPRDPRDPRQEAMRRDPRQVPPNFQGGPRPVPQGMPRQQMPPQMQAAPQMPPQMPVEQPRKKSHTGGLVFYTIFFAGILAFYVFAYGLLGSLQDWLVGYEAAQPTRKCQEVFDLYFSDPDWGQLYDMAGIEQTTFEGKDAFITYMDQRTGDQELTYLETSAGLAKYTKKYIVRLGSEKIASFTLEDQNQAEAKTDVPDWELGEVQLFYQGSGSYEIRTLAGYQVAVNGVALDDNAVIRVATTRAGEYLPEGVTVPAMYTWQVGGLMTTPTVTITDANGTPVDVSYDEASHTFAMSMEEAHDGVSEDEKQLALDAIKTYAIYMSQKGGGDEELSRYFQRGTELYKTLSSMERMWNQSYSSSKLTDESVTDAVRYSDDLFSARVSVNLHLVRGDGTEKVTEIDRSMFFKRVDGTWKCYDMTAVDVNEPVEKVRLTFRTEESVLQSELVDASAAQVQCPAIEAPGGQKFAGWMMEEFKDNGDRVLRLVMVPDESGKAAAPANMGPMNLYPLFESNS